MFRTDRFLAWSVVTAVAMAFSMAGCASAPEPGPSPGATGSPAPTTVHTPAPTLDHELQAELLDMLAEDQRTIMEGTFDGQGQRTERLKEILAEHGWPGISLVGDDGDEAAWAIAQHADLDLAFQSRALELLRAAAAVRDASPGNLAYLKDRVAVASGDPQLYGTQIRCGEDGPVPATPILEEATVEDRRAAAGLDPLAAYLAEMAELCSEDLG